MALTELRIASRRSQLAMVQTNWVKAELEKAHPGLTITVEAMATQGDKILDVALAKIGDKGLFTKELEAQMLVGRADIAVHSLKDLPTNLPEGLMLGCITEREDPADALVLNAKNKHLNLATLPEGAVVGTSSLRRLAQLRYHYPHLVFKDVRGNVITRLEKLDSGAYDCLILAAAGLGRLGFEDRIDQSIPGDNLPTCRGPRRPGNRMRREQTRSDGDHQSARTWANIPALPRGTCLPPRTGRGLSGAHWCEHPLRG